MTATEVLKRIAQPLLSRKVRVAIATALAAFLAKKGLHLETELVVSIVTLGTAVILGIAHEDAGSKSVLQELSPPTPANPSSTPPEGQKIGRAHV